MDSTGDYGVWGLIGGFHSIGCLVFTFFGKDNGMGLKLVSRRLTAISIMAVLTMVSCAGFATIANADQVADGDITVSAGAHGELTGHSLRYLRIADYTNAQFSADGDATGLNVNATLADTAEAKLKAAVAHVDDTYDTDAQNQYSPEEWIVNNWKSTNSDQYGNTLADNTKLAQLAQLLGGADQTYAITDEQTPTVTADADATTLTVPVDYGTTDDTNIGGLYLLVDESASNTSRAMIVPSPIQKTDGTITRTLGSQQLGVVNMKNQIITVTQSREDKLATVGSKITFTGSFTGPDFTGITTPKLVLWSDPSSGLDQPTMDDITVNVDGKPLDAGQYSVNVKANKPDGSTDANAFNLTFTDPTVLTGKTVEVSVKMRVNEHALEAANDSGKDDTYANTMTLQYSNNATDPTATGMPADTVTAPIMSNGVHKVELGNDQKDLTGARFQLLDAKNTVLKFTAYTVDDQTVYALDANGLITDLGADDISRFMIAGLDRGEYTLMETQAPAGHVLGQGAQQLKVKLTVTADASTHDRQDITVEHDAGVFAKFVDVKNDGTLLIRNATSLNQLPATGATGIVMIGGAILLVVLGAGSTMIGRKLRHAK